MPLLDNQFELFRCQSSFRQGYAAQEQSQCCHLSKDCITTRCCAAAFCMARTVHIQHVYIITSALKNQRRLQDWGRSRDGTTFTPSTRCRRTSSRCTKVRRTEPNMCKVSLLCQQQRPRLQPLLGHSSEKPRRLLGTVLFKGVHMQVMLQSS